MLNVKLRLFILFLLTVIILTFFFLNKSKRVTQDNSTIAIDNNCKVLSENQTLIISGIEVDILVPSGEAKGDVLVLPGWNFDKQKWCNESNLCRESLEKRFRLILPQMGKSIYASSLYPETRKDWQTYPQLSWVIDSLIPQLQDEYCILIEGQKNFMLGLSTGARGVILIGLNTGKLFTATAVLSGDYDQTKMTEDNLMKGYYGDYNQFPERWTGSDNPVARVEEWKLPIYLGHGKKDKVVPPEQTELFYNELIKHHPQLDVKLNMPNQAEHDFEYWGSEGDNVLRFFRKYLD